MRHVSTDMPSQHLVGVLDAIRREHGYLMPHEQPDYQERPTIGAPVREPSRRPISVEAARRMAQQAEAYDREIAGGRLPSR